MRKNLHPVTLIDAWWMFTVTKQWMLAPWGGGWRVSAVATAMWMTSHVPDSHARLSHHEMTSVSISSSARIGGLWIEKCVRSWISASMRWKRWWQCWNITKFAPGGSHECSYRNIKNTAFKFVRTSWTNTRLKVIFSSITSSPVTRCGVTTTSRSQNGSPWSGNMCISNRRKSSRCGPQQVKWCALSFGIGKGWSFWISSNPDKPSRLTATSRLWLSLRLEFPESCNMKMPGSIQIWRPWSTLSILAGLSYHTHRIVQIWCLLTSICSGRGKMDCMSNIFLATTPSCELWKWAFSAAADFYEHSMQALVHRWRKCIANGGN